MNRAYAHASICLLSWWCHTVGLSTEGHGPCFGRESRARHVLCRRCIPLFCGRLTEHPCMFCSLVCDTSLAVAGVIIRRRELCHGVSSSAAAYSRHWHELLKRKWH
jgi:hypothetical protein